MEFKTSNRIYYLKLSKRNRGKTKGRGSEKVAVRNGLKEKRARGKGSGRSGPKKERGRKVWDWVLNETNNFGRGWTDPKWGKLYKGRPGRGGRFIKPDRYNIK